MLQNQVIQYLLNFRMIRMVVARQSPLNFFLIQSSSLIVVQLFAQEICSGAKPGDNSSIRVKWFLFRIAIQVDREDFNRPTASSLAAKIENLADSIDITARRWLAHDRQTFGQDCLDDTESLVQAAAKLHDEIVNGANVATIRQDTEGLYQNWRRVYNHLVKCQTDERPALGRFASQLTPAVVELRTLVAQ